MTILRNLIRWITVDRAGVLLQVKHFGDGIISRVENLQPQGHHFAPPAGAQGLAFSPGGVSSEAVTIAVQGVVPDVVLQPGEGGLHLLGTFKVFLHADGDISLGAPDASDYAAKASATNNNDQKLSEDITTLKSALESMFSSLSGGGSAPITGTSFATAAGTFSTAVGDLPSSLEDVASEIVRIE